MGCAPHGPHPVRWDLPDEPARPAAIAETTAGPEVDGEKRRGRGRGGDFLRGTLYRVIRNDRYGKYRRRGDGDLCRGTGSAVLDVSRRLLWNGYEICGRTSCGEIPDGGCRGPYSWRAVLLYRTGDGEEVEISRKIVCVFRGVCRFVWDRHFYTGKWDRFRGPALF